MAESFFDRVYKNRAQHVPDVLSCLSNLSNDEVFTPPEVVNQMLDMLPQELFSDPNTTFLDPACKTGVFLREIAKRLLEARLPGYERRSAEINEKKSNDVPLSASEEAFLTELQAALDHIFHKQLFGIGITELTSLLARRSLYCSKYPNGPYSITHFDDAEGNIRFKRIEHTWKDGKCVFCGASKEQWGRGKDLETHAYEFIHVKPERIFDMKFDVIISNPPYQLSDGGAQASAIPIYNRFVVQSIKLNPTYLCMIIPARWMTGGRGLDKFRNEMIHDKSIQVLHDYPDSKECFTGVEIKGGVCYFLRNSHYTGKCKVIRHLGKSVRESERFLVEPGDEVFVRDDRLISIKNKVMSQKFESFDSIVSSMRPYGLRGDVFKDTQKYGLPVMHSEAREGDYKVIGLDNLKRAVRFVPKDYPFPIKNSNISKWKLFVTRNWGIGSFDDIPSNPIVAGPGELCTETFVEIGPFSCREYVINVLSYLSTKFFRALVAIRKQDQGASKAVYHYVPMQDFSKPWTDSELYVKYGLSQEEINFIESMIRPMDTTGGDI